MPFKVDAGRTHQQDQGDGQQRGHNTKQQIGRDGRHGDTHRVKADLPDERDQGDNQNLDQAEQCEQWQDEFSRPSSSTDLLSCEGD